MSETTTRPNPNEDAPTEMGRGVRRRCVGCGTEADPREMIRCVPGPEAPPVIDLLGKLPGRGAWVHPRTACIERAVRFGFARSFRQDVRWSVAEFVAQLQVLAERRITGLLRAAYHRKKLAFGLEAVKESASKAALVMISEDARALTKDTRVQELGRTGKAIVWSTKEAYGHLLGRAEIGILAVLDAGIAQAVTHTISLTRLGARAQLDGGDAHCSEVR